MGNIIQAECRICGFKTKFSYGGNRSNYLTYCPVPAINLETKQFENINYYEHKDDKKYIYYFDERLKGDNLDNMILYNFNLEMNKVNNFCPKCESYAFDFEISFFTD